MVNYQRSNIDVDDNGSPSPNSKTKPRQDQSASDLDFAEDGDTEEDEESVLSHPVDLEELGPGKDPSILKGKIDSFRQQATLKFKSPASTHGTKRKAFKAYRFLVSQQAMQKKVKKTKGRSKVLFIVS